MDSIYSAYNGDEQEIDLIDLMKELLRHWKSIILCAVICTALGAGFSMYKASLKVPEDIKTDAQAEAELEEGYKRLQIQYESDLKLYELRDGVLEQYQSAVDMLGAELEKLESIDASDDIARLNSLITISSLQDTVLNSKGLADTIIKMNRPEAPENFESYAAENIDEVKNSISPKYMLIGFILGGFIGCAVWGMVYLLDGRIKTVSEISHIPGINMLGASEKTGLVAANVKNFFSDDIKSVLVTGGLSESELKTIADAVRNTTGVENIKFAEGLNYNADTAILLSSSDAVVLVEKLKSSKRDDVLEELAMIKNAGKKLIGVAI